MKRKEARRHAFSLVFQIDFAQESELNEKLHIYLDEPNDFILSENEEELPHMGEQFSDKDKLFITTEYNGVIFHLSELDALITKYAKGWSIDRLSKVDLSIMRLAIYEILYETDIPTSVSINEAVELAKTYSADEAPSFINGILGNVVKERVGHNG